MSEMHDEYEAQHKRTGPKSVMLSNGMYDRLKFVVMILLPGVGTLYFALSEIWGFPNAEQVVGTITALAVFLGLFLRGSSKTYEKTGAKYDGFIDIDEDVINNKKTFNLVLDTMDPYEIEKKKDVVFKVNKIE